MDSRDIERIALVRAETERIAVENTESTVLTGETIDAHVDNVERNFACIRDGKGSSDSESRMQLVH